MNIEKENIVIRKALLTDKEDILILLRKVFNVDYDEKWWDTYYCKNPIDTTIQLVALHNNIIIAHKSIVPIEFIYNKLRLVGGQSTNSATDPNFRRMGIFSKMNKIIENEAKLKNWDFLYSFAGPNSFPGYLKQGWESKGKIKRIIKIINIENCISKLNKGIIVNKLISASIKAYNSITYKKISNKKKCELLKVEKIELNDMKRNKNNICEQNKTDEYIKWRYDNTIRNYDKYLININGIKAGYAIIRIAEKYGLKAGFILEYYLEEKKDEKYFINEIEKIFINKNVDFITLWRYHKNDINWKMLGYIKSPIFSTNIIYLKLNKKIDIKKFAFQLGDTDSY